jgi:hypothetical protein
MAAMQRRLVETRKTVFLYSRMLAHKEKSPKGATKEYSKEV